MKIKNRVMAFFLVSLFFISNLMILSNATESSVKIETSVNPESYLIEDVPYIGQETYFHCAFASMSMQLNYFGANTTVDEVFFLTGGGFALLYSPLLSYLPLGSYRLSQLPDDREFLGKQFGLSVNRWIPDYDNMSSEECWNYYWIYVKENITQNIPVSTSVDPFAIPSIQNQFDLPESYWESNDGGHGVVIVGFNESNNTVCFNDPGSLYYGNPELGNYCWMNLTDFRHAVEETSATSYLITVFFDKTDPLSKEEMYQNALNRNIEKLKGNKSAYCKYLVDQLQDYNPYYGINATKTIHQNYGKGINNRIKTIFKYKLIGKFGIKYRAMYFICNYFPEIYDRTPLNSEIRRETELDGISTEKKIVSELLNSKSEDYNYYSELLHRESENWTKISLELKKFLKRGIFLSLPREIYIMNKMEAIMANIIAIEEAIIAGPP